MNSTNRGNLMTSARCLWESNKLRARSEGRALPEESEKSFSTSKWDFKSKRNFSTFFFYYFISSLISKSKSLCWLDSCFIWDFRFLLLCVHLTFWIFDPSPSQHQPTSIGFSALGWIFMESELRLIDVSNISQSDGQKCGWGIFSTILRHEELLGWSSWSRLKTADQPWFNLTKKFYFVLCKVLGLAYLICLTNKIVLSLNQHGCFRFH